MQNSSLFYGSIEDNLTFNKKYKKEELREACEKVGIYDYIESLPLKFNTIISESGDNISGGQKQKLLLARAILLKKKILLLDEATSNIDSNKEIEISNNIDNLNITKIIIAHRLSTIKNADYIYVLKDKKIVEQGTHDRLWSNKGTYYKLYKESHCEDFKP